MNPCGRAVDWIQFPFEVDAVVHDGPDAPIVRLRWVYTNAPFLPVGTGCVVLNRIWDADQWSLLTVGQLPIGEADYVQDARWALPAGFRSDHICHPEWLATGEPYPNDLPPQEYTEGHMPTCCGWVPPGVQGGFEIGGEAGDVYTAPYDRPTGGFEMGGSAGDVFVPPVGTEGGFEIGGEAGDVYQLADATEGGFEIGGEAGDEFRGPDANEGGFEIGGEAGDTTLFGVWERDECGLYFFVPEFTGWHFIKVYGAGGRGADSFNDGSSDVSGGGGGGGAEANGYFYLVRGVSYEVYVGCGGASGHPDGEATTMHRDMELITAADYGRGAVGASGGAGGLATSSVGDQKWDGGSGADGGPTIPGGGAGSSASYSPTGTPPGTGNPGVLASGGLPTGDGGYGGDGGPVGLDGAPGGAPGGGGGGGGASGGLGADGHDGKIYILWG